MLETINIKERIMSYQYKHSYKAFGLEYKTDNLWFDIGIAGLIILNILLALTVGYVSNTMGVYMNVLVPILVALGISAFEYINNNARQSIRDNRKHTDELVLVLRKSMELTRTQLERDIKLQELCNEQVDLLAEFVDDAIKSNRMTNELNEKIKSIQTKIDNINKK